MPDERLIQNVNARRAVLLQGLPRVHSVLTDHGVRMTVLDPCEWGKGEELGYSRVIDGMHFMCGLSPPMGTNLPMALPNSIKTPMDGDARMPTFSTSPALFSVQCGLGVSLMKGTKRLRLSHKDR